MSLRTHADDRLPFVSPGRVEGVHGIVEGRHDADVRLSRPSRTRRDDLSQLPTIRLHNKIDRQAVCGKGLDQPYN